MTMRPLTLLAASWAGVAVAAPPCAGVDTTLTEARAQAFAPLVAGTLTERIAPAKVAVRHYLAVGGWIVVGAEVPVADGEGYFFFERSENKLRFHDSWAGYADPSEAGEVADWARKLGAPDALARCFAHAAVAS